MLVTDEQSHITHAVIGGEQTMDFGISNNAEFFQILSSSLYSDQILAVVREVLCNAWDAHIEAKKTDVPITVSLADDQLIVRDYGFGIPKDQIQPIYGVYGQSTKRLDGKVTGGFGLGCKAPFAYKDHFEVTSWNQGTKTIYAMSRSSSEANGKPGITPIVSMPTEESGLQVKIAVDHADKRKFIQKIKKIVEDGEMLVMFDPGNSITDPALAYTIKYSAAKLGFTLRLHSDESYMANKIYVRYGNVIYPVLSNSEYEKEFDTARGTTGHMFPTSINIVLHAEPNSLTISPSRESLSLQEKTIATLKRLLQNYTRVMSSEYMVQRKRYITKKVLEENATSDIGFNDLSSGKIKAGHTPNTAYLQTIDEFIRYAIGSNKLAISEKLYQKYATRLVKPELKGTYHLFTKNRTHTEQWHHRYVYAKVHTLIDKHVATRDYPMTFLSMSYNRVSLVDKHTDFYSYYSMKPEVAIQKIVILTCSLHTMKNRILHWKSKIIGNIAMVQQINRHNPDLDKIRAVLNARKDITFIDLTVKYEWEIKERDAAPEERKPKGIVRLDCLLDGHTPGKPLVKPEYITQPDFIVHMSRSDARLDCRFTQPMIDKIVKRFGKRGGICTTTPSFNSYINKEGVKSFDEFLIDQIHAHLVRSKKVRRHHSIQRRITFDYTIVDAILTDKELSREMGIYTELSEDDVFFYQLYRNYDSGKSEKIKEIRDFFAEAKPIAFFSKAQTLFSENIIFKYMDIRKVYNLLKNHKSTDKDEIVKLLKTHLKG